MKTSNADSSTAFSKSSPAAYGKSCQTDWLCLRSRGVGAKRSLASREFALGIEVLERFIRR